LTYIPQPEADDISIIPERWDKPTQEMKDAFIPLGAGSRGEVTIMSFQFCFANMFSMPGPASRIARDGAGIVSVLQDSPRSSPCTLNDRRFYEADGLLFDAT
jgi:hypothetical protein